MDVHGALNERAQVWRGQSHLHAMLSQACQGAELLSRMSYCCFIPSHVAGAGFDWALPWQPCIALYRPWQKNAEKAAVWGKHAPGPGDRQHDPGGKARALLG